MSALQSYQHLLDTSRRVNWRLEDLVGEGRRLDFTRPFLPETFAQTEPLDFLSPAEKLKLNQIRARGYLALFELVEAFIVPFISDQADDGAAAGPFPRAARVCRRGRKTSQDVQHRAPRIRRHVRYRMRPNRSGRGHLPSDSRSRAPSGHYRHPGPRVDVAGALPRKRQRRSGSRSAVQELAQVPLDRGSAARKARWSRAQVDRSAQLRTGHYDRDRGILRYRRVPRRRVQAAGGARPQVARAGHRSDAVRG